VERESETLAKEKARGDILSIKVVKRNSPYAGGGGDRELQGETSKETGRGQPFAGNA